MYVLCECVYIFVGMGWGPSTQ